MFSNFRNGYTKISQSKDTKALIANFGYLSLLQIASYLFPLITIPYLAATIGVSGFGNIAFASAVVTWCMSIVTWGFDYTATRDVARNRNSKARVSIIFSNIIWTRLFLTLLSFLFLLALTVVFPKFRENRLILILTFLMVPGRVMFPEWLFQALERMKYITILSILSKLLFTIAVFIFIKNENDYILQPLISSVGFVVSGLLSLYLILIRWHYTLRRPSLKVIFRTIRSGADVFINNFMPNLYNSMSHVILGVFYGSSANGILSAGDKALSISQQFLEVLSRTFFPFLSRRMDKHQVYARLSIIIASVFTFIVMVISPFFIKIFYTNDFYDAIFVSFILAPSILFLTISNVYGTNFLILNGHERILRNISMSFSVLGFVIAFPLIKFLGVYGAALTIVLTRGLLAITTMVFAKRTKNTNNVI